jgi:hypothetical protein
MYKLFMLKQVLATRRHLLTVDNAVPPKVALWDLTTAKQASYFLHNRNLHL